MVRQWKPNYIKPQTPTPQPADNKVKGSDYIPNLKELKVGSGDKVFKVDKRGFWLGAEDYDNAPLKGSMAGVLTATGYTQIFRQVAVPTSLHIHDVWYKTDTGAYYIAAIVGADQIAVGEWELSNPSVAITDVVGAGDLAAKDTADFATDVSGATKPEANATVGAKAGTNLKKSDNTVLADADVVTSLGTAAAIASQGSLATQNTADFSTDVSGATKPEENATVGATTGIDLKDSGIVVLNDQDIKNIVSLNAGETINGATLPVPVYVNNSDGEVYKCDANASGKLKFFGFAISNSTDGNSIKVQVIGIVPGFTGLTKNAIYYISDSVGTISTTPGTVQIPVGIAVSATEVVIQRGEVGAITPAGTILYAIADTERSNATDTYTKVKDIEIINAGTYRTSFELKASGGVNCFGMIYKNGVAYGTAREKDDDTYETFTEDLAFAEGDLIQLYIHGHTSSTGVAYIRNFRLYTASRKAYLVITD